VAVAQPMVGNLAWAPLPAFEEVEVIDRFNGVPTLGVFGKPGSRVLFWRVLGYVPAYDVSMWLYVPLDSAEEYRLESAESSGLLDELIFRSEVDRKVSVGLAVSYRLLFEYEWVLPANSSPDDLVTALLRFSASALKRERVGARARRKAARRASKALEELAAV
jgi:hypothetical protein